MQNVIKNDTCSLVRTAAILCFFLIAALLAHSAVEALCFPSYNSAAEAENGEACLEENEDLLFEGWTRSEVIRFCKTGR